MFFRNLIMYRFDPAFRTSLADVESVVARARHKPIGPQQMHSAGFVSPFGEDGQVLSHRVGDAILITMGFEQRALPKSAIDDLVRPRARAIELETGKPPRGRALRALEDEARSELMPRALINRSRTAAILDLAEGIVFVDTTSRPDAELVVGLLRRALESFPVARLDPECCATSLMTDWLAGEIDLPAGISMGDEVELRDGDRGAIVKARRQVLDSDEIKEHLKVGKKCARLALDFGGALQFVLGDDLSIRKLTLTDAALKPLEDVDRSDAAAVLDAEFALFSELVRRLATHLFGIFGVPVPQARDYEMRTAA